MLEPIFTRLTVRHAIDRLLFGEKWRSKPLTAMRTIKRLSIPLLAAVLVLSMHEGSVAAQSSHTRVASNSIFDCSVANPCSHTWVSSSGLSVQDCSIISPCRTFQQAHDRTISGGQISCLDSGNYDSVFITKAISIVCDKTPGSIRGFFGSAVVISVSASDTVILKGLDIDPTGSGSTDMTGIVFNSGAALHVDKVRIRNIFSLSPGFGGGGIYFQPNNNYAQLYVTDSVITDSVGGSISAGIVIAPRAAGSVNASISRVRLENNSTGIIVDGTRSTGFVVNATIRDTVVAGSQLDGVLARSSAGHAAVSVLFDHSVASGNFGSGVRAVGDAANGAGSAVARIGDSSIVHNVSGVSAGGAGVVQSFKNNRIAGNLADGTPIPAYAGAGGTPLQ